MQSRIPLCAAVALTVLALASVPGCGVRGSLEARAGSGEISAEGDPRGGWIVHTGSGSVRLRLALDAAFDLNAHTSSGSISLNRPVTVQGTIGRKEVRGKVRGGGPEIEVQTSSGNIEIL